MELNYIEHENVDREQGCCQVSIGHSTWETWEVYLPWRTWLEPSKSARVTVSSWHDVPVTLKLMYHSLSLLSKANIYARTFSSLCVPRPNIFRPRLLIRVIPLRSDSIRYRAPSSRGPLCAKYMLHCLRGRFRFAAFFARIDDTANPCSLQTAESNRVQNYKRRCAMHVLVGCCRYTKGRLFDDAVS